MKRILIHFSLYSLISGPHPDLTSSKKLTEIDYNRGIGRYNACSVQNISFSIQIEFMLQYYEL